MSEQKLNKAEQEVLENTAQLEAEQLAADNKMTKSEVIRAKYDSGLSVAQIARELGAHYSFVYTVVKQHLKGNTPRSAQTGPSRSDHIRSLADQGLTPGQIAKELGANYSFVHTVVKKHRESQGVGEDNATD